MLWYRWSDYAITLIHRNTPSSRTYFSGLQDHFFLTFCIGHYYIAASTLTCSSVPSVNDKHQIAGGCLTCEFSGKPWSPPQMGFNLYLTSYARSTRFPLPTDWYSIVKYSYGSWCLGIFCCVLEWKETLTCCSQHMKRMCTAPLHAILSSLPHA